MRRLIRDLALCALACVAGNARAADHVDITWMSITNVLFDFGQERVLADGYITRLPESIFSGGGGVDVTSRAMRPDEAAVREVHDALGGGHVITRLITGHSHFDHSFDTPVWANLTGAPVIGSQTTCLQLVAVKIPPTRCRAVGGGERIDFDGVRMHVIRWNHSGDPAKNPLQHNPRELATAPVPAADGGLRAGVAEDFPNGGGNRAYLFVAGTSDRPLTIFFQDSASPVDLTVPIVLDGHDYGAPLDNLRRALADAGIDGVDLWIGTANRELAALILPVLKPRAYLPVHWDGLWRPFKDGVDKPWSDPEVERALAGAGVNLVAPGQYMDKWRLDRTGMHPLDNSAIKRKLGFD
jgi:hypothetical protein